MLEHLRQRAGQGNFVGTGTGTGTWYCWLYPEICYNYIATVTSVIWKGEM